jgi:DNA-directed RNA polymerase sigma subunit (sigma70/sigma32)
MDVSVLPEPHRTIVKMRFGNPGEIPMTIEAVAESLGLAPVDVVGMETEALEAMGNNARGVNAKRWRYS